MTLKHLAAIVAVVVAVFASSAVLSQADQSKRAGSAAILKKIYEETRNQGEILEATCREQVQDPPVACFR